METGWQGLPGPPSSRPTDFSPPTHLGRPGRAVDMDMTKRHKRFRVEAEYDRDISILLTPHALAGMFERDFSACLNAQLVPNIPISRSATWAKM